MILPFAGTSLVSIALEKLDRIGAVEGRYFAAAEDELLGLAERHSDIKLLRRSPNAVAPGYNGNEQVFGHCREIKEDYIIWINACCPLLRVETIEKAIEVVKKTTFNSYTSVIKTTDWIFDMEGEPVTNKAPSMISTAHSQIYFKVAHAFHILRTHKFVTDFVPWSLTKNDPALVEIPEEESYDVNSAMEFELAEAAYRRAQAGLRPS